MLSLLLNGIPGLNVDATGKIVGATKGTKKVVKKVIKKTTAAVASALANDPAGTPATGAGAATGAAATAAAAAADQVAANVTVEAVDETPSALMEFLASLDPVVTAAVIGLVLLVAFYIYRTRFSSTGQRGDTYLLLGPMGSGKTALFFRLKQGLFRETHTSMKENDATFVPIALQDKVSPSRFVDLPGHASQRGKLDLYKPVAKGVIFVVDGSSPSTLGKVSQLLYTLLVDPILVARRTPFFIAFTKSELMDTSSSASTTATTKGRSSSGSGSDSASESDSEDAADGATGVGALVARLEGMLDKTRDLQSTMSELGTDGEASVRTLGRPGHTFRACPVTVGSVSAAKGDIDELVQFIQAH